MTGIYGTSPEDRHFARLLDNYLDEGAQAETREERVRELTIDKIAALPNFYASTDGIRRYTNIEDAVDSIKQDDWIAIGRAVRDNDPLRVGSILIAALVKRCAMDAENEVDA